MQKYKILAVIIIGILIIANIVYFQHKSNVLQIEIDKNTQELQDLFTPATTTGVAPFVSDVYQSDVIISNALSKQQSTQPATANQ